MNGHIYFSHVDDESERELYEVTVRSFNEPDTPGMIATWAVPVSNEKVIGVCEVRLQVTILNTVQWHRKLTYSFLRSFIICAL